MPPCEDSNAKDRIELPGFGRPIEAWSKDPDDEFEYAKRLSAAVCWSHEFFTLREASMLHLVNSLSDKPDWTRMVHDEEIVKKWEQEAMSRNWKKISGDLRGMSKKMFTYCIEELRDKAKLCEETGVVPVLDASSCVLKSDKLVPAELKVRLKKAIAVLEDIPEPQKDWHPGSDGKVLDLVHPSLFPLIYGHSRILPRETINLDNCLHSIGEGVTLERPSTGSSKEQGDNEPEESTEDEDSDVSLWSTRFQWLPCNVSFPDGENARIDSYINNLHPLDHEDLYRTIEQLITIATPLWNIVYQCNEHGDIKLKPRIECKEITFEGHPDEFDPPSDDGTGYVESDQWYADMEAARKYNYPEPADYSAPAITAKHVQDNFAFLDDEEKKMQVIVKLANIHLNPEKPAYGGGAWHIEGQLNEHIVATALYYYDNENTTDSCLNFRTGVSWEDFETSVDYEQGDYRGFEELFGFENFKPSFMNLGSVLTREDRMIAFPNGLQHRVEPFELADKTKPGHRKIVALFLVAPTVPIISTANVPPQQRDWWIREIQTDRNKISELPMELVDMVGGGVEDFPISLQQAKEIRKDLMAERRKMDKAVNAKIGEEWRAYMR